MEFFLNISDFFPNKIKIKYCCLPSKFTTNSENDIVIFFAKHTTSQTSFFCSWGSVTGAALSKDQKLIRAMPFHKNSMLGTTKCHESNAYWLCSLKTVSGKEQSHCSEMQVFQGQILLSVTSVWIWSNSWATVTNRIWPSFGKGYYSHLCHQNRTCYAF